MGLRAQLRPSVGYRELLWRSLLLILTKGTGFSPRGLDDLALLMAKREWDEKMLVIEMGWTVHKSKKNCLHIPAITPSGTLRNGSKC